MWIDDTSISPRGDTQLVDQQLNTKGKQREIWIRLQQPQQRNATLKTQPMPRAILPAILTSKRGAWIHLPSRSFRLWLNKRWRPTRNGGQVVWFNPVFPKIDACTQFYHLAYLTTENKKENAMWTMNL